MRDKIAKDKLNLHSRKSANAKERWIGWKNSAEGLFIDLCVSDWIANSLQANLYGYK